MFITKEWELVHDRRQWVLSYHYESKPNHEGVRKPQTKESYHPTLEATARYLTTQLGSRCDTLDELLLAYTQGANTIAETFAEHIALLEVKKEKQHVR